MVDKRGSPTVRRRRLGAELRRLREEAGLTIDVVAERLECSTSKISRMETGQTGASPRDVRDMLALYRVPPDELDGLIQVAREARKKGWWQPYGAALTGTYVGFETAASKIKTYEALCVPGLLQTSDYAASLIRAGDPDATSEHSRARVRIRMERQALLTQDDPIDFWVILDEAVLHRAVGGLAVMREQIEHLVMMGRLPNVTLQVLPFARGAHSGLEGSFAILHFPDEIDPDMIYVAMATGGVFQEKPEDLRRYAMIFDQLRSAALPPDESISLIESMAREPS